MNTTRRTVLRAGLAAPALGLGLPGGLRGARAAAPLKVGFVYVAPIGDAGFTYQHELGRRAMQAALNGRVQSSYVENVSEGAAAERVIHQMAANGNGLIYTTSFGFMNPTYKVAGMFPKVKFEHCTGYKRRVNMGTYSARFYEGRYLAGLIAGRMTKSNIIGYVVAFPIPEVVQGVNAFTIAARSVNPKVQVKLVWTSSWFDPGKERAAADTLISQGADILTNHTDSTAVVQAGEERGVKTISYNSDMSKYGPKTCLTGVTMVWNQYYIDTTKKVLDGTWKSGDVWGGVKSGMVRLAPYNKLVPDAVRKEVAARQAAMANHTFSPFQGPILDQSGKVKVAKGTALTDPQILALNWFVQGVEGKV